MDEATFTLPSYDGITFHVVKGSTGPETPATWLTITATDIDGEPLPNFQIGFSGP